MVGHRCLQLCSSGRAGAAPPYLRLWYPSPRRYVALDQPGSARHGGRATASETTCYCKDRLDTARSYVRVLRVDAV
jgi:hypothetical protein